MTNELKQCPVCGAKDDAEDGIIYTYFVLTDKYSISCEHCGCSTVQCLTEKDAEAAWNKMCEMKKENKQ